MRLFRRFAHLASGGAHALARALTSGFDALTGPVGRWNDRAEAHLSERTPLLRAYYARTATQQAAPLPLRDGPADLALRGGVKSAA